MRHLTFHLGNRHYPVHWQFGVQNDKVHTTHLYAIVLFKHITVEVLLQAVVYIGGVGEVLEPVHSVCPAVGFGGVNLVAAFPVIDFVCTIGAAAHKVERAGNACIGIVYSPLGAEGLERRVPLK